MTKGHFLVVHSFQSRAECLGDVLLGKAMVKLVLRHEDESIQETHSQRLP